MSGQVHDQVTLHPAKEPLVAMQMGALWSPQPVCIFWNVNLRDLPVHILRHLGSQQPSVEPQVNILSDVENENQVDATEWFIAPIKCSTCFGHFYAHHQELETICVLLPPMVCDAFVAGCRSGAG